MGWGGGARWESSRWQGWVGGGAPAVGDMGAGRPAKRGAWVAEGWGGVESVSRGSCWWARQVQSQCSRARQAEERTLGALTHLRRRGAGHGGWWRRGRWRWRQWAERWRRRVRGGGQGWRWRRGGGGRRGPGRRGRRGWRLGWRGWGVLANCGEGDRRKVNVPGQERGPQKSEVGRQKGWCSR